MSRASKMIGPAVAVVTDPGTPAQRAWYTFPERAGQPAWAVEQTRSRAPGRPVAWLHFESGEFEPVPEPAAPAAA